MRTLVAATLLALTALAGCDGSASRALPPKEASALLVNRSWIDRLPKRHDDRLHVFRFTPGMGGGVYQDRTIFAGDFELFVYEETGREIRFNLLHTGERKTTAYTIEELPSPGPEGVDLKLTLAATPRGPARVFYSWRKNPADVDALLAAHAPR